MGMHCGTIELTQAQLSAAVKVQLGFESQPSQKTDVSDRVQ